jgi:hypothetical protein
MNSVRKLRKKSIIDSYENNENNENNSIFYIIFQNSYHVIIVCYNYTLKIIKIIINISWIYLLWIFLHYLASQLYVKMCVPYSVVGFLLSPFMVATPHCQGLRWIIYNSAIIINNMWIIFGAWITSNILIINKDTIK